MKLLQLDCQSFDMARRFARGLDKGQCLPPSCYGSSDQSQHRCGACDSLHISFRLSAKISKFQEARSYERDHADESTRSLYKQTGRYEVERKKNMKKFCTE